MPRSRKSSHIYHHETVIKKKFTIFNREPVFSIKITSYVNFGTPFIYVSLDNLTRNGDKKKFTIFNRVFSIKIISYVNFGTPFICVSLDNLTRTRNGDKKKNLQFLIVCFRSKLLLT